MKISAGTPVKKRLAEKVLQKLKSSDSRVGLLIKRWQEDDEMGYSCWRLQTKRNEVVQFPAKSVLKRIFREISPKAQLGVRTHGGRWSDYIFVFMPTGLKKSVRVAFVKAVQKEINAV